MFSCIQIVYGPKVQILPPAQEQIVTTLIHSPGVFRDLYYNLPRSKLGSGAMSG